MIIKMVELEKIDDPKVRIGNGKYRIFECSSFHTTEYTEYTDNNISEIYNYLEVDKSQIEGMFILSDSPNCRINMITNLGHEHILWDKKMFKVYILNDSGKTIDTI